MKVVSGSKGIYLVKGWVYKPRQSIYCGNSARRIILKLKKKFKISQKLKVHFTKNMTFSTILSISATTCSSRNNVPQDCLNADEKDCFDISRSLKTLKNY